MKKNFIKLLLSVFVFAFTISIATTASALTATDISMLEAILGSSLSASQISSLNALASPAQTNSSSNASTQTGNENSGNVVSTCINLNNSMSYGSRDASTNGEVTVLQDFLQSNNYLASSPTGFYGLMTVSAVKAFQSANGIAQVGYVGPLTRAEIKSLSCNGDTTTVVPPVATSPIQSQLPTSTTSTSVPVISSLGSNQGKAGDLITISGSKIVNGATISFKQNNVIVTTQNINYIPTYFNVPNITPGDYTVYLNQNCQNGVCATSNSLNFTVTGSAVQTNFTPTLTSFSINQSTTGVNGDMVNVSGTNFRPTGTKAMQLQILQNGQVLKSMDFGSVTNSTAQFIVVSTFNGFGPGIYQIRIENSDGLNWYPSNTLNFTLNAPDSVPATSIPASFTMSLNASFTAPTYNSNTTNQLLGSYVLGTNSAGPITISSLNVGLSGLNSNGGTIVTDIANLYVTYNGVSTSKVNAQQSNNFNTNFTIPANGSVIVNIYGDISSSVGTISTQLSAQGNNGINEGPRSGPTITILSSGNTTTLVPTISSLSSTQWKPGDTITVYGSNLKTGGVNLNNGGNNLGILGATSISSDGTQLTFVVPLNILNLTSAGNYQMNVQTGGAQAIQSNSVNFTLIAPVVSAPAPIITSVSPSSGTSNSLITIYGQNLTGVQAVGTDEGDLLTNSPISISSDGTQLSFTISGPFILNNILSYPDITHVLVGGPSGKSNILPFTINSPLMAPITNTPVPTNLSTACPQNITVDGVSYTISPCSISISMVHGSGNKNFTTTIIPASGGSYDYNTSGYGVNLPAYGILGGASGSTSGNKVLNLYFNDSSLPAGTYIGYLPIHIYQDNEAGSYLNFNFNLTVTQ